MKFWHFLDISNHMCFDAKLAFRIILQISKENTCNAVHFLSKEPYCRSSSTFILRNLSNQHQFLMCVYHFKFWNAKFYLVRTFQYSDWKETFNLCIQWIRAFIGDCRKLVNSFLKRFWFPENIYLFKVNNLNTRKMGEIYSKSEWKTPEQSHWLRSCDSTVKFVHISHLLQLFIQLILNLYFLLSCS